ncbi:MAG: membrane protein insertase YidC [Burkholderiales bacterium]|jgi:YidC/Oxa1 family membrane protein insertase|nr:membrane protein insertase YidC [Burkholderiales bacterium]MBP7518810.1 membrane protein insertase YidC [Leptothrix sp. (in: b-proteobacteria)]HQY08689.1 membrane protein insertase YidC [Burkholderiaceae bacterium]
MNDVRRALLWGIFSLSLVMLWDGWTRHNGGPSMFSPATPAQVASAAASANGVPSASGVAQPAAAAAPGAVPAAAAAASAAGETVQIVTDTMKATLDSRGGSLVRVELLTFRDQHDAKTNVVLLDRSAQRVYTAETGLIAAGTGAALPNHTTAMTLLPGDRQLAEGQKELKVAFETTSADGLQWVKTYTFRRGEYTVGVQQQLKNGGGAPVAAQAYYQLLRDGNPPPNESSFYFTFTGPAVYTDAGKFQKIEFKDIEKREAGDKPGHETKADNGWVAMVQHYFTSAWLLSDTSSREIFTRKVDKNLYAVGMIQPLGELAPGASRTLEATLYIGPQEEKKLETLAPGLELVKDYGWLTLLAKPLFWLLDRLHGLIGNWGWAIVALVVLLKAAFYWLNASAYRSMGKMKAINPKVQELRERHKDDPQKMQQEMMRIYREEKVNPLGGCLPIFVQMPFFIALYWVLLSSVEMRGAPWLYVSDLAQADTLFFIIPGLNMPVGPLPLLMVASTVLQTWLNPTPPDPVQAKMMWIMPLAFSVMFFYFPAGLVLYWFTNNVLSIAQQWMINRQLGLSH